MLFRDAHVEETLRVFIRERLQARGPSHGGGDRHDVIAARTGGEKLLRECRGPARLRFLECYARDRVDGTRGMHLVVRLVDGRRETVALLRHAVDDDGALVIAGIGERVVERIDIVAVDGADILHAQLREHLLRHDGGLDALLHRMQGIEGALAYPTELLETLLAVLHELVIAVLRTDIGQVLGQATNRRRVGTTVVVDHHDGVARLCRRQVIERLPAHAARQSAVADHGHGVAVPLALERKCLRQAVHDGNRRRGVRGFRPVVLGLAAVGVAGQAALLTQRIELVCATREHLVHVGLVRGVEDDRIIGRVEGAVQRDGELHDAQIWAQVTAGGGDLLNEQRTHLVRELTQLLRGEVLQIAGRFHQIQQCHGVLSTSSWKTMGSLHVTRSGTRETNTTRRVPGMPAPPYGEYPGKH